MPRVHEGHVKTEQGAPLEELVDPPELEVSAAQDPAEQAWADIVQSVHVAPPIPHVVSVEPGWHVS